MPTSRLTIALLALLLAMVTLYLWPTLGSTLFFGYADNAVHGLPLAELHARILKGEESALWSPLIYGGHPLFAESQGAFANPVNILLSWALPPLLVSSLLHWIGLAMGATGMFALGRVLGLSPWASTFTAIAAVFSPFWLGINTNMTVTAAVGWVPWALWAFEIWLKRLDVPSAILFAAMTAMLVLPGYPHLLHASVMYMLLSMLPSLMRPGSDNLLLRYRALIGSGLLAVILVCGLVAVQLLPLAELIEQSHRSETVKLQWFVFPELYHRGFFFALDGNTDEALVKLAPSISSLMVCLLMAGAIFWRPTTRFFGVLLAGYLLGNLGMGYASPIFNFVYDHNLVPGIHKFRITHPFFLPALIAVALLAGSAIDGLIQLLQRYRDGLRSASATLLALLPGLLAAGVVLIFGFSLFQLPLSRLFLVTAVASFVAIAVAGIAKRPQWLAPTLLLLLLAEIFHIKFVPPHFASTQKLQMPTAVQQIAADKRRDYKFMDLSDTSAFVFKSNSPSTELWLDRMLAAVAPSSNLLWDVPQIGGAFALNLRRQTLVEPYARDEAAGVIQQTPGLRLIDLLGIGYIVASTPLQTAGFTLQRNDAARTLLFYRNDLALPRFQHYRNAVAASDVQDAFEQLKHLQQRTLIVEADPSELPNGSADAAANDSATTSDEFSFTATRTDSDYYSFNVDAKSGGWLFIADNMYPGWIATLDDKPAPLFAAQVMGKAVWVPAGRHQVEVRFISRSFQIGLAITLVTISVIAVLLFADKRRRQRGDTHRTFAHRT